MGTLQLISLITVFPPFLASVIKFRELSAEAKWIAALVIGNAVNEWIAIYVSFTTGNNSILYHFFTAFMLLCIVGYGYTATRQKSILFFVILAITPFAEFAYTQGNLFNSVSFTFIDLVCIGTVMYVFYRMVEGKNSSLFWINGVLLFYLLSSFVFLSILRYGVEGVGEFLVSLSVIYTISIAIANLLFAYVIWKSNTYFKLSL